MRRRIKTSNGRLNFAWFVKKCRAKAWTGDFNDILNITIDHDESEHNALKDQARTQKARTNKKSSHSLHLRNQSKSKIKGKNNSNKTKKTKNKCQNKKSNHIPQRESIIVLNIRKQEPDIEECKLEESKTKAGIMLLNYFEHQKTLIKELKEKQPSTSNSDSTLDDCFPFGPNKINISNIANRECKQLLETEVTKNQFPSSKWRKKRENKEKLKQSNDRPNIQINKSKKSLASQMQSKEDVLNYLSSLWNQGCQGDIVNIQSHNKFQNQEVIDLIDS